MLISNGEIEGEAPLDLRIEDGRIQEIGVGLTRTHGEPRLDASGGAILPGLHDHHIHLHAFAAAQTSVSCGPPEIRTAEELARVLKQTTGKAAPGDWVRGIGYHESVAGDLDSQTLDDWTGTTPTRIQHRGGALWMLNSAAINQLALTGEMDVTGMERDAKGRATGRLFRLDRWLRDRLAASSPPNLGPISEWLARHGVTGVTDASPNNDPTSLAAFTDAVGRGHFRQHLWVMGNRELPSCSAPGIRRAALKIMLDEVRLPDFDDLQGQIKEAHADERCVAIHCVTRAELVFATEALSSAGVLKGDRIEHAAVTPPELMQTLADLSLTVVTQHGFLHDRGDSYVRDVDRADQPWLYRGRGFLEAGVPLGGGTDAPFGPADPWKCIRGAVERRTENGRTLEAREALTPEHALALFTSPAENPGENPRRLAVGHSADLCVLDRPWSRARDVLSSEMVAATIRSGEVLWQRR